MLDADEAKSPFANALMTMEYTIKTAVKPMEAQQRKVRREGWGGIRQGGARARACVHQKRTILLHCGVRHRFSAACMPFSRQPSGL